MATAKKEGGLYYDATRKIMVDAEGKEVQGADLPEADTPASEQPGAAGSVTPEERMATAIATALRPTVATGSPKK